MHNSTNNPEMHWDPNDSHQRDFDVKHHPLKPIPFMPVPVLLSCSVCKNLGKAGSFSLKLMAGYPCGGRGWCEAPIPHPWASCHWQVPGAGSSGWVPLGPRWVLAKASPGVSSPSRRFIPHKRRALLEEGSTTVQRQRCVVVKHTGFGRGLLGSSLSLALISYWTLGMVLNLLCPSFLLCKVWKIIVLTSQCCCENWS